MLPATVQFIIAMIASALTDRLTRKMDYMREEQRILMELLNQATGNQRIAFTADHRRRLASKGKDLTAKERKVVGSRAGAVTLGSGSCCCQRLSP